MNEDIIKLKKDGNIVFQKDYHTIYAKAIVHFLYKNDTLLHKQLADYLGIKISSLSNIFSYYDLSDLILKTRNGKYTYYSLTDEARQKMDLEESNFENKSQDKTNNICLDVTIKEILKNNTKSDSCKFILENFDMINSIFNYSELIVLLNSLGVISISEKDFEKILKDSSKKSRLELVKSVFIRYLDFLDFITNEDSKDLTDVFNEENLKKYVKI